jgi:hypothetical protein
MSSPYLWRDEYKWRSGLLEAHGAGLAYYQQAEFRPFYNGERRIKPRWRELLLSRSARTRLMLRGLERPREVNIGRRSVRYPYPHFTECKNLNLAGCPTVRQWWRNDKRGPYPEPRVNYDWWPVQDTSFANLRAGFIGGRSPSLVSRERLRYNFVLRFGEVRYRQSHTLGNRISFYSKGFFERAALSK